jgi:hypothetical protein
MWVSVLVFVCTPSTEFSPIYAAMYITSLLYNSECMGRVLETGAVFCVCVFLCVRVYLFSVFVCLCICAFAYSRLLVIPFVRFALFFCYFFLRIFFVLFVYACLRSGSRCNVVSFAFVFSLSAASTYRSERSGIFRGLWLKGREPCRPPY